MADQLIAAITVCAAPAAQQTHIPRRCASFSRHSGAVRQGEDRVLTDVFYAPCVRVRRRRGFVPLRPFWLRRLFLWARALSAGQRRSVELEQVNAAAERLLDQYGNSILRMAYVYLHNMDDAEEILQETLLRFLRYAPAFENEAHEKAWLLRVAANLSKNRLAWHKAHGTDTLRESLVAEQREDLSFVWDAVKCLPVKYRRVIHLFYYEGCSTGQIARILQEKEATVRSQLMRGREKLKVILEEAYDFEGGI